MYKLDLTFSRPSQNPDGVIGSENIRMVITINYLPKMVAIMQSAGYTLSQSYVVPPKN